MHEIYKMPAVSKFWVGEDSIYGKRLPQGSIYHYTASVMAVKNILSEGELWLSKSTVMNDYSEIIYGMKLAEQIFNEMAVDDKELLKIKESFLKYAKNDFSDSFILCFSENGNSRLLWDSYSNKNGYNIEFTKDLISDFVDNVKGIKTIIPAVGAPYQKIEGPIVYIKDSGNIRPEKLCNYVLYKEDEQKAVLREIIQYIKDKNSEKRYEDLNEAFQALVQTIPFLKDPSLRDEEEYRLVIRILGEKDYKGKKLYLKNMQQYREKNNILLPYIVLKMKSKEYIKSVSLGYTNCNELSVQTMEDFISTLNQRIEIKKIDMALRW